VRNRAGAGYLVCGEPDQAIAQCEAARRVNPFGGPVSAQAVGAKLDRLDQSTGDA